MNRKSIIGVDVGGTNIRAARIIDHKIQARYDQKISADESESIIVEEIIHTIEQVFDESVTAIGVGVPSVVDIEKGIVYYVHNIPSWNEVHLKSILENHFSLPVFINNDVNCFVLAEKIFGKGKNYKNIVGLALGTGLGGGLIINDKLHSGANCGAGEFGMMPYRDKTFEYYCSGQFFKGEYGLTGEDVFSRAEKDEPQALEIFEKFGVHLASAMMTIMFSADPDVIIFGGSVSRGFPYFINSIRKTLQNFAFPNSVERLKIEHSTLQDAAVLGAAALCYENNIT